MENKLEKHELNRDPIRKLLQESGKIMIQIRPWVMLVDVQQAVRSTTHSESRADLLTRRRLGVRI